MNDARTCDVCRTAAATRLLVRSDLGGSGARMLACAGCKPPEGEWQSMGLDPSDAKFEAKEAT